MSAYYNEFDPFAAAWLKELIAGGLIAPGDVDARSIKDVQPDDLKGYQQCHFFAGIGGWSLALRVAGWADDRSVWTGSCPCQPFSLAGARQGFDDSRHLWPEFARLIRHATPSVVFGEQVASASDWLGIVRGDLDAMGYAVGAIPIEAASSGADHLRDRFWFVGHHTGDGRGEGRPEYEVRSGRAAAASDGSLVNAQGFGSGTGFCETGPLQDGDGTPCPGGFIGVADTDIFGASQGREQRGGEQCWPGGDPEARNSRDLADSDGHGERRRPGQEGGEAGEGQGEVGIKDGQRNGPFDFGTRDGYNRVIGADGKARRVKSGIRLLAHGVSGRVGKLRGFGNAIDHRPAAAFIQAADEAIRGCA